jgi:hypothetical protein
LRHLCAEAATFEEERRRSGEAGKRIFKGIATSKKRLEKKKKMRFQSIKPNLYF